MALLAATAILPSVYADSVLKTDGFNDCGGDGSIKVNKVDISFDKGSNKVNFDLQGDSDKEQEVTASLVVEAYGVKVFEQDFDPCDDSTKVEQLCPRKRPYYTHYDHANNKSSPIRLFWCPRLDRNPL